MNRLWIAGRIARPGYLGARADRRWAGRGNHSLIKSNLFTVGLDTPEKHRLLDQRIIKVKS
jgi:hypothetical protein